MIKKLKENVILDNRFATVFNDDVEFSSGVKGTHLRVESKSYGGVLVIPIMEDGTISLIESYRYAVGLPVLEFPQGGVAKDETSGQAAVRELHEETGLELTKLTFVGRLQIAPAFIRGGSDVYIAWGCRPSQKPVNADPFESIVRVKQLGVQEAFDYLYSRGEIVDASSLAALSFLTQHFNSRELQEMSERGSAFLMGCYCATHKMSVHSNPFRNDPQSEREYMDWLGGWNFATHHASG